MKQKRIAIVGDSFTDIYCKGTVNRISPEAPVPVLDVGSWFSVGGGAVFVANLLHSLRVTPVLFTITDLGLPYEVVSPKNCTPLKKTRFVCEGHQLLRADEPARYLEGDLIRMEYPDPKDFDIIAFIDYDKGVVKGGQATFVDTKKPDLSVFHGSRILKVNNKEFAASKNHDAFKEIVVTKGAEGMDYIKNGVVLDSHPSMAHEVIDVTGAGDVVSAIFLQCLADGIEDMSLIMKHANKAASIAVSKLGNYVISYDEIYNG